MLTCVHICLGRIDVANSLTAVLLASAFATTLSVSTSAAFSAVADKQAAGPQEFSGTIIKQVNGKKHQAQVFAKGDRLRLEYKYALRTNFGYASIEIIRLDRAEVWYLLAQQRELLVMPLDPDDVLPIQPALPGDLPGHRGPDPEIAERAVDADQRRGATGALADIEIGHVVAVDVKGLHANSYG